MTQRELWVSYLRKTAYPVLKHLADETLHENFPFYFHPDKRPYACLEAFGRTICGIAPFLEAEGLGPEEKKLQSELVNLARKATEHAVDPASPDFLNFCSGSGQPLVDTAFLAHGILRAPHVLFEDLDSRTKTQLADALKSSRVIVPGGNNWLFFSAMVEAALYRMEEAYEKEPVENALHVFDRNYYVGDGTYGDGPAFHWDYYNSYVIQPMFIDILRTLKDTDEAYAEMLPRVQKRASRYAGVLEQMIGPDGTYTVIGRSSAYRFGAFQLLSQAALQHFLPDSVKPGQVRAALTAVLEKCFSHPDMFDENGWLRPGIYGCQPSIAEGYINIGSLYLCCTVFLALGLPPEDPFWSDPPADWSSRRIWSGQDKQRDSAFDR